LKEDEKGRLLITDAEWVWRVAGENLSKFIPGQAGPYYLDRTNKKVVPFHL
jgi:hypothetical protein